MHSTLESKVVILGEQGVGKTSIIMSYIGNNFNRQISPTIGASFFTCKVNVLNEHVKLQIWDTAGQERFRAMAPMYYRNSDAAIIVYDVTSEQSFEVMKSWIKELKTNVEEAIVLCILANKKDLAKERVVQSNEGENYALSIGALYYETSAVSKEGIEDAFLNITLKIVEEGLQLKRQNETEAYNRIEKISLHNNNVKKDVKSDEELGSYLFCC